MIVDDEDHAIALASIAALHIGSFADVSLRSVSICVVDEHGEVCHEAKTAAQPAAIAKRLSSFSADVKAVRLEAGTLTQYLTYGLQAAGFEVICMEARQVKNTLAAMRNKTDRNDARGIAGGSLSCRLTAGQRRAWLAPKRRAVNVLASIPGRATRVWHLRHQT